MATTNKETNNYNIDSVKKNASTGTLVGSGNVDLKNYGIDYSQEQRDEIAGIFANEATKAYGSAQNEYANQMAQQQTSLQDTIRRSQAQAVATGASRGMQAANELSSMLGLQEQAAQGATTLQGDYATALANAQKNAMDIQNTRAQIGSEIAAADIAGEAQKYSVGLDYQANDPYRVISEIAALRASGDSAAADALLTGWLASQGASEGQVSDAVYNANTVRDPETGEVIPTKTDWTPGNNGLLNGHIETSGLAGAANFDDLAAGRDESFYYTFNGVAYALKGTGAPITSNKDPELYRELGKLSGNRNAENGSMVYYNGEAYISAGGIWRKIGLGDLAKGSDHYKKFLNVLAGK